MDMQNVLLSLINFTIKVKFSSHVTMQMDINGVIYSCDHLDNAEAK